MSQIYAITESGNAVLDRTVSSGRARVGGGLSSSISTTYDLIVFHYILIYFTVFLERYQNAKQLHSPHILTYEFGG